MFFPAKCTQVVDFRFPPKQYHTVLHELYTRIDRFCIPYILTQAVGTGKCSTDSLFSVSVPFLITISEILTQLSGNAWYSSLNEVGKARFVASHLRRFSVRVSPTLWLLLLVRPLRLGANVCAYAVTYIRDEQCWTNSGMFSLTLDLSCQAHVSLQLLSRHTVETHARTTLANS